MARVICNLPNFSGSTNGPGRPEPVTFEESKGEWISEDLPDAVAEAFADVPGFRLAGRRKPADQAAPPATPEPEKQAEPAKPAPVETKPAGDGAAKQ